ALTAADTFTAVTATCTHESCTITGFNGQAFVCPCHGSRFSTSGAVQNGPATPHLRSIPTRSARSAHRQFASRVAANVLAISVGPPDDLDRGEAPPPADRARPRPAGAA